MAASLTVELDVHRRAFVDEAATLLDMSKSALVRTLITFAMDDWARFYRQRCTTAGVEELPYVQRQHAMYDFINRTAATRKG